MTSTLIIVLIVFTSHEAWEFSPYNLPLIFSAIFLPFSRDGRWLYVVLLFVASLRVVSLGLVCVSVGQVSVNFDMVLDYYFVTCVLEEFSQ